MTEQCTWFRSFGKKPDSCGSFSLLNLLISGDITKKFWIKCAAPVVPLFFLQWKSDERTKHYLTLMLLAINWRYWQEGINSRMRMKVERRLIQERFFEIHKDFAKQRSDTFLQSSTSDEGRRGGWSKAQVLNKRSGWWPKKTLVTSTRKAIQPFLCIFYRNIWNRNQEIISLLQNYFGNWHKPRVHHATFTRPWVTASIVFKISLAFN